MQRAGPAEITDEALMTRYQRGDIEAFASLVHRHQKPIFNFVLRQIKAHHESVATLVLSSYPENQYGLNVLRAGASGFVSKTADDAELCRAIRAAVRGGRYVSPELAEMLVSGMQGAPGEPRHSVLSEREFQIFCKLAEGKSVSEIAAKLFLSVKTVSTYRTRILEKMSMKTNADITYYAIKNNLLQ